MWIELPFFLTRGAEERNSQPFRFLGGTLDHSQDDSHLPRQHFPDVLLGSASEGFELDSGITRRIRAYRATTCGQTIALPTRAAVG